MYPVYIVVYVKMTLMKMNKKKKNGSFIFLLLNPDGVHKKKKRELSHDRILNIIFLADAMKRKRKKNIFNHALEIYFWIIFKKKIL
jgi:hypothetical protein